MHFTAFSVPLSSAGTSTKSDTVTGLNEYAKLKGVLIGVFARTVAISFILFWSYFGCIQCHFLQVNLSLSCEVHLKLSVKFSMSTVVGWCSFKQLANCQLHM